MAASALEKLRLALSKRMAEKMSRKKEVRYKLGNYKKLPIDSYGKMMLLACLWAETLELKKHSFCWHN